MSSDRELAPEAALRARAALESVMDPEVPVLSIVELGIVRDVAVEGAAVTVTVTPTYSGCPAMRTIEEGIVVALERAGFAKVLIKTVYAPAWTTDWIEAPAREKLRAYGIAPPERTEAGPLVQLAPLVRRVPCPFCGSSDTSLESEFGATACKSLHTCHACRQPFEHFKGF
ncbi:MAG TPA: 1,2-phenylacetyl-CoA epoxidase subunit PaaD [Gemmatimonadales bacterium]